MLQPFLFPPATGCRQVGRYWWASRDGDPTAMALYARHYSRRKYCDGRDPKLFVGPGEKLVLITEPGDALFIWRRFRDDSGQIGVNNAVFRNEGPHLSSLLIAEAESLAWYRWPGERRLYTYVDPGRVRSSNPGFCFKAAGWKPCGITKDRQLLILEKTI